MSRGAANEVAVAHRARKASGRRLRSGRLLVAGVLALVAFLYYRPLTSYVQTRGDVEHRRAQVAALRAEKAQLERRLARSTSVAALRAEARRIGYVRPGERLFIVKGIPEWRRAHASTLRRDG
jgi:cell division protein FtsB